MHAPHSKSLPGWARDSKFLFVVTQMVIWVALSALINPNQNTSDQILVTLLSSRALSFGGHPQPEAASRLLRGTFQSKLTFSGPFSNHHTNRSPPFSHLFLPSLFTSVPKGKAEFANASGVYSLVLETVALCSSPSASFSHSVCKADSACRRGCHNLDFWLNMAYLSLTACSFLLFPSVSCGWNHTEAKTTSAMCSNIGQICIFKPELSIDV